MKNMANFDENERGFMRKQVFFVEEIEFGIDGGKRTQLRSCGLFSSILPPSISVAFCGSGFDDGDDCSF